MTPAETLLKAARVVREHAANVARESGLKEDAVLPTHLWFEHTEDYQDAGDATHVWIALVGPHIGEPLARLFETAADEGCDCCLTDDDMPCSHADTLALARAILREQP